MFFLFIRMCNNLVRAWTIQPYVSTRSGYRSFGETIRFEEEASWQIASVSSCRRQRISGIFG